MKENFNPNPCPECGAALEAGLTCQDHFHQMLFWEAENPENGEVHHLAVLCYHLQHPSLYSPEGLQEGMDLLVEFLERGSSPQEVRRTRRARVDSGRRSWKIRGAPGAQGAYDPPIRWTMTAADVVAAGEPNYRQSVQVWAESILAQIPR
jgi:hypothetical protein